MKRWLHPDTWLGRATSFFAVLALPLLRLLVSEHYPPWRPEVLLVLAAMWAPCVLLGWLTGRAVVFYATFAAWVALFSASTLMTLLIGSSEWVPFTYWVAVWAAVVGIVIGAARLLRERLTTIATLFLGGMLLAEVVAVAAGSGGVAAVSEGPPTRSARPAHTIHVVLDEQVGLAGFGDDIPESAAAERAWRETLLRHGFQVFPKAYSNFAVTIDSLPAVLWDRPVAHLEEAKNADDLVRHNRRFADARDRGLRLAVYQSDFLRFDDAAHRYDIVRGYRTNELSASLLAPGTVLDRAHLIAVRFGLIDRPIAVLLKPYLDRNSYWSNLSPLSTNRLWPQVLLDDVRNASEPTLFFAHLINPHSPFAYRADGSIRPLAEITKRLGTLSDQRRAYAEQSHWLSRQVDGFLSQLKTDGVLDAATVILHGDHGSRIRAGDREQPVVDWSARDVTVTFSTLFAYRTPDSGPAAVDDAVQSLITLLRRVDGRPLTREGEDLTRLWLFRPYGSSEEPLSSTDLFKE